MRHHWILSTLKGVIEGSLNDSGPQFGCWARPAPRSTQSGSLTVKDFEDFFVNAIEMHWGVLSEDSASQNNRNIQCSN